MKTVSYDDLRRAIFILENKVELLEEDLQCIHMYLDTKEILRENAEGTLSIIGRLRLWELVASLRPG